MKQLTKKDLAEIAKKKLAMENEINEYVGHFQKANAIKASMGHEMFTPRVLGAKITGAKNIRQTVPATRRNMDAKALHNPRVEMAAVTTNNGFWR